MSERKNEGIERLIKELGGILYGLYDLNASLPKGELIQEAITRTLTAVRDGRVEILCPECSEPIKVLKCEGCHLENVDGYIRH